MELSGGFGCIYVNYMYCIVSHGTVEVKAIRLCAEPERGAERYSG